VLLDWVDDSLPFFLGPLQPQASLASLLAGLLTPFVTRQDVSAFVLGQDNTIQTFPLSTYADLLGSGRHVVFSNQGRVSDYANTFLLADRSLTLARWHHRLFQPLRLPQIYEPNVMDLPWQSKLMLGAGSTYNLTTFNFSAPQVAVAAKQELYLIDLQRWGEPEAIHRQSFNPPLEKVTGLSSSPNGQELYLVDKGRVFNVSWSGGTWRRQSLPVGFPLAGSSSVRAFYHWFPNNRLWLLEGGSLLLATSTQQERLTFLDEEGRKLPVANLVPLPEGSLAFVDDSSQPALWYAHFRRPQAMKILGPVDVGPLFFCLDRRGLLYVVETASRRLALLLPSSHRRCLSCGFVTLNNASGTICPNCQARLHQSSKVGTPYSLWLDLDLAPLGSMPGPLTVDEHLNLFIFIDQARLAALTFSRRDLWGEMEN